MGCGEKAARVPGPLGLRPLPAPAGFDDEAIMLFAAVWAESEQLLVPASTTEGKEGSRRGEHEGVSRLLTGPREAEAGQKSLPPRGAAYVGARSRRD